MSHAPELQLELRRTERYFVYECIANGGMASVHLGLLRGSLGFSRVVAIKRLHAVFTAAPRVVAMLAEEARLVSRIRHMNVVPTLDVLESNGEIFVVMEYVRGAALSRLMADASDRGELVPVPILVTVLVGALRGLHAAHDATDLDGTPLGIVHRDVSPQNIMVGVGGLPRVIDFGVARALTNPDTTRDGEFKGKLAYASPEQLRGETVTRRSDVFAAGTVLWEILTGRRLFHGPTDFQTYRNVLTGEIEDPRVLFESDDRMRAWRTKPEIEALGAIAMRALERDPELRYATAAEMSLAMEQAAAAAPLPGVGAWVQSCASEQLALEHQMLSTIEHRALQLRDSAMTTRVAASVSPPAPAEEGVMKLMSPPPEGHAEPPQRPSVAPQAPPAAAPTPAAPAPAPGIPLLAAAILVLAATLGGAFAGAAIVRYAQGTDGHVAPTP